MIQIRPASPVDLSALVRIWNACADSGEVLYLPMTESGFRKTFLEGAGRDPGCLLTAESDGAVCGFIHGVPPLSFPLARPGEAFVTVLMVDPAHRGQGVGTALFHSLSGLLSGLGAQTIRISNWNPVDLGWRIPGTPGHDHNNAPGLDLDCAGAGFFIRLGFTVRVTEIAMYLNLSDYTPLPDLEARRAKLRSEGIDTGVYHPEWDCDYDTLCDHVNSDYWRDVLSTEIAAWKAEKPNPDPRFHPDGLPPAGPRPLITATTNGRIVGFTGPVDLQRSGRGWFTGICTDPDFERRGIATILFHLLMQAFIEEGAAFSTLFTGETNHAQKIYLGAGFRIVRRFGLMERAIQGNTDTALR